MEKVIEGKTIQVNEQGYLTDFSEWTKEIGLAIAKGLVEAHGGTITFDAVDGGGTTFIVRLPLQSEASSAAA